MQTIKLDISQKNNVPLLYVKQRDVGHKFAIELYENGALYPVNEGNTFSVWYSGASGDGNYTEIDGKPAVSVDGNHIEVQMIMQMLNEPGGHEMCVVMYGQDNKQKGFWNIPYFVEAIPGADSEAAEAYYQAFLDAQKKAEEAAERAEAAADRAESAGGGESGGGGIIVSVGEGNTATHTALEIYDAIQNKKTVVFHHTGRLNDEFVPLKISKPDLAVFSKAGYPTEFDIYDIEIDDIGTIRYNTHFSSDLVNQSVEKVETDLVPVSYLPQDPTPEQQAQARINIGVVEKRYELIETITLGEEVSNITRTQEPDGTPYNLAGCIIRATIPPADGKSGNAVVYYTLNPGKSLTSYMIAPVSATATLIGFSRAWTDHGRWMTGWWTCRSSHGEFATYYENPYYQGMYGANDGYLSRVEIVYSSKFPVGTVIEILGVRA